MAERSNGDAGAGHITISRDELDALLKQNLSSYKDDIAKAAADRAVRDTQRFVDSRLSRTDAMLAQLAQSQQQVNRHFQQAEEADLDPEERKGRDLQRQLEETTKVAYAQSQSRRSWEAYGKIQKVLAQAGISDTDERVIAAWNQQQLEQNPEQWATDMAVHIAGMSIEQERTRSRTNADANQEAERRRAQQAQQRQAVQQSNERRAQDAGQVDTSTPNGTARDWHERYMALKNAGKHTEARQFIEARAKRAARGDVRDVSQL